MFSYNSVKIVGDYNLVFQSSDNGTESISLVEFLNKFTEEKDARIKTLEETLLDKRKIEDLSTYKVVQLELDLKNLKQEKNDLEIRVTNLITEFSKADSSKLSELYKESFNLFINGKLEEAVNVLEEDKLLKQEHELQLQKENLAKTRLLKARLLAIKSDFRNAVLNIEKMIDILSDAHTQIEAGNFYSSIGDNNNAKKHYKEGLRLSIDENQKAIFLHNLGAIYSTQKLTFDAEKAYEEALAIRRKLAQDGPKQSTELAFLLNNVARLKNDNDNYPEAIELLKESISILDTTPQHLRNFIYYSMYASMLEALGNAYTKVRNFKEAEEIYNQTLRIIYSITPQNENEQYHILSEEASCLSNIGYFYQKINLIQKAESSHTQALFIFRKLLTYNPLYHKPYLVLCLNNLGTLYGKINHLKESEACISEALILSRELAASDRQAHVSSLAESLSNLGVIYKKTGRYPEADALYNESLEIYRELAVHNPRIYQIALAETAINLALLYLEGVPDREKCLSSLEESIYNLHNVSKHSSKPQGHIDYALSLVSKWGVDTIDFFNRSIKRSN